MEFRHIRIDSETAINSKKKLLLSQISLINIKRKLSSYKFYRKKEITEKNKLLKELSSTKTKLNQLKNTLPQQEKPKKQITNNPISKKQSPGKKDITSELEEIKRKLAKLKN